MEHEFDSSWTCNYCGITEEKAKRGEQCPQRMREQLANATPISSVEYIGPERKIAAFVINVPQRLTPDAHKRISHQWQQVMAGTVHENTPVVICEAGMTVQAIDEPVGGKVMAKIPASNNDTIQFQYAPPQAALDDRTSVTVLKVGSPVAIGEEVDATIIGVLLRDNGYVQYECSWWDGNSHNSKWMAESEVRPLTKTGAVRIGFNGHSYTRND